MVSGYSLAYGFRKIVKRSYTNIKLNDIERFKLNMRKQHILYKRGQLSHSNFRSNIFNELNKSKYNGYKRTLKNDFFRLK